MLHGAAGPYFWGKCRKKYSSTMVRIWASLVGSKSKGQIVTNWGAPTGSNNIQLWNSRDPIMEYRGLGYPKYLGIVRSQEGRIHINQLVWNDRFWTLIIWGVPWSCGYPNSWMVYKGKSIYKWMMNRGTPISANPHFPSVHRCFSQTLRIDLCESWSKSWLIIPQSWYVLMLQTQIWLVVWTPLKNMSSSIGMIIATQYMGK